MVFLTLLLTLGEGKSASLEHTPAPSGDRQPGGEGQNHSRHTRGVQGELQLELVDLLQRHRKYQQLGTGQGADRRALQLSEVGAGRIELSHLEDDPVEGQGKP